jgi:hypothetical protein
MQCRHFYMTQTGENRLGWSAATDKGVPKQVDCRSMVALGRTRAPQGVVRGCLHTLVVGVGEVWLRPLAGGTQSSGLDSVLCRVQDAPELALSSCEWTFRLRRRLRACWPDQSVRSDFD